VHRELQVLTDRQSGRPSEDSDNAPFDRYCGRRLEFTQRAVRPDLQGNGLIETKRACQVDNRAIPAKHSNGFVTRNWRVLWAHVVMVS